MSKVILITGGASGLGWAMAQQFYARGDSLLLVDLNDALLQQRQTQLSGGDRVHVLAGDITDSAFQTSIFDALRDHFGRLDVLVNNAGITHRSLVQQTDPEVFDKVMQVDWQAPVRLACTALPLLAESKGTIINIGSMAGWMPVLGRAAYCAAKSALAQFFEVLRCEVEAQGIHVLNVYPSFLDTPIEKNALGSDGKPAKHGRSTTGQTRSADWMAELIVSAEESKKPWLFPDRLSWFGSCLWRVWPGQYLRMMKKRFATEMNPAQQS